MEKYGFLLHLTQNIIQCSFDLDWLDLLNDSLSCFKTLSIFQKKNLELENQSLFI